MKAKGFVSFALGCALAAGSGAVLAGEDVTFEQLDADQNGAIDQQEAQAHPGLDVATVDANADGSLDQAEFASWVAQASSEEDSSQQD